MKKWLGVVCFVLLIGLVSATIVDDCSNIVGLYHLDGDASDDSGNGNDGSVNGAVFGSGKVGSALSFDGVDDYVEIGDKNLGGAHVKSISAWTYINDCGSIPAEGEAVAVYSDESVGVGIGLFPSGGPGIGGYAYDGSSKKRYGAACSEGWHNVVLAWNGVDSNSLVVYVDGIVVSSSYWNWDVSWQDGIYIGRDTDSSPIDAFNGLIDEVIYYDRQLTSSEVSELYNSGNGVAVSCGACAPTTCQVLGYTCGDWSDGCGGTLNCGTCTGENICTNGQCVAQEVCVNGETRACGTGLLGICSAGTETCSGGVWGSCVQNFSSGVEICGNGIDEDCDGSDLSCEAGEAPVLAEGFPEPPLIHVTKPTGGNIWIVAQDGSGDFADLNDANSGSVQPGDIIRVKAGTYTGRIEWSKSGTENNPIWIEAYGDGISFFDNPQANSKPHTFGGEYVVFDGGENRALKFRGAYQQMNLRITGTHITVRRCHVVDGGIDNGVVQPKGTNIYDFGDYSHIYNNLIENADDEGIYVGITDDKTDDHNIDIRNNIITSRGSGIQVNPHEDKTADKGILKGAHVISGNYIFNGGRYYEENPRAAITITPSPSYNQLEGDIYIYNNMIYNYYGGIGFKGANTRGHIYTNTIVDCDARGAYMEDAYENSSSIWRNNIVFNCEKSFSIEANYTYENNLEVDPGFISTNPNNPDFFKISSSSPARDAGWNLSGIVDNDFFDGLRPQNGVYDIGAHEYISGGLVLPPEEPGCHPADIDCDECVSQTEISSYLNRWFLGEHGVSIELVGGAIKSWKNCEVACVSDCSGKECGSDGCGGSCGTCIDGETCSNNVCEAIPQAFCGDGNCDASESCSSCEIDCGVCPEPTESFVEPPLINVIKPIPAKTVTVCDSNCDYKTLEDVDGVAQPGWLIQVKAGNYSEINWNSDGKEGNEIVIEAFGDGDAIFYSVNNGLTKLWGKHVIFDGGPERQLIFDGSRITSTTDSTLRNFVSDIILRRVEVRYNPGVMMRPNAGLKIYNSEFHSADSVGIYGRNGNNFEIRNNIIHDNGGTGIQFNPHSTGEAVDNVTISGNAIYSNGHTFKEGNRPGIALLSAGDETNVLSNVYVYNNLLWDNAKGAISNQDTDATGFYIYNNVIYNNGNGAVGGINNEEDGIVIIRNNIIFDNNGPEFTGFYTEMSNNLLHSDNPKFISINPNDPDFLKISADSPAKDAGYNLSGIVDIDYFNTARPQNGIWDIGAHEYVA